MAWIYLCVAGVLECAWAIGLKYSDGFTRPLPSILTALTMAASFWLLSLAMRQIPVGTAYAVWTGIGAVGVATLGMLLFKEPANLPRLLCFALILSGIVGLRLLQNGTAY